MLRTYISCVCTHTYVRTLHKYIRTYMCSICICKLHCCMHMYVHTYFHNHCMCGLVRMCLHACEYCSSTLCSPHYSMKCMYIRTYMRSFWAMCSVLMSCLALLTIAGVFICTHVCVFAVRMSWRHSRMSCLSRMTS